MKAGFVIKVLDVRAVTIKGEKTYYETKISIEETRDDVVVLGLGIKHLLPEDMLILTLTDLSVGSGDLQVG